MSVAMLIESVTDDEDTIIAGLMHDALEDVPGYTYEQLVEDCGIRVAEIVKHVTEPLDPNKNDDEQLPWLQRKEVYLQMLRSGNTQSVIVSAADKIHNTESFLRDAEKEGIMFVARFGSSIRNRLWFHKQVLAHVQEVLGDDNFLTQRFITCTIDFENIVDLYQTTS